MTLTLLSSSKATVVQCHQNYMSPACRSSIYLIKADDIMKSFSFKLITGHWLACFDKWMMDEFWYSHIRMSNTLVPWVTIPPFRGSECIMYFFSIWYCKISNLYTNASVLNVEYAKWSFVIVAQICYTDSTK